MRKYTDRKIIDPKKNYRRILRIFKFRRWMDFDNLKVIVIDLSFSNVNFSNYSHRLFVSHNLEYFSPSGLLTIRGIVAESLHCFLRFIHRSWQILVQFLRFHHFLRYSNDKSLPFEGMRPWGSLPENSYIRSEQSIPLIKLKCRRSTV